MKSDRLLARLVVSSLTLFIVLIIALGSLVVRQIWLQQKVTDASETLQESIEELEETTSELQDRLTDIRTTSDQDQFAEHLDNIGELLDDVDKQLDVVDSSIEDINVALDDTVDASHEVIPNDETAAIQDPIDQVFTIFVVLVSGASIAIAVLLSMAIRVKRRLDQK